MIMKNDLILDYKVGWHTVFNLQNCSCNTKGRLQKPAKTWEPSQPLQTPLPPLSWEFFEGWEKLFPNLKVETPSPLLGWFPKFYPVFSSEVSPNPNIKVFCPNICISTPGWWLEKV